jgi:formiminoglutamate deiminase
MYEVAASLTPESYEEIATAVFTEMAMAGITSVGEFHYVHHQPGGKPYDDPNEMGHALIRAARRAGVRIALLDACYLMAGFNGQQLHPHQERFSDQSVDAWLDRVEALANDYDDDDDVVIGLAPHSVRAVPDESLRRLVSRRDPGTKIHIHVSEQPVENEACLEATGLTPVGFLARVGLLGEDTTAIHATHLTPGDITMLGDSGTGVCYCATTERDLADGIGPSAALHGAGSPLCVGSDSHAVIDLFEEARGMELHERLRSGSRGNLSPRDLARAATVNGAAALGVAGGRLETGEPADFIVVSRESPRTTGASDLAGIIYSATGADVTDVVVGGEPVVSGGYHPGWDDARDVLGGSV